MAHERTTNWGVNINDLRLPAKEALLKTAAHGFHVVELPATSGDLSPQQLSSSGRRHLLQFLRSNALEAQALSADMPRLSFGDPVAVDERVAQTCQIIELSKALRVPIVTADSGMLTDAQTGEPLPEVLDALSHIGEYADTRGVRFALRPTNDSAGNVTAVLEKIGCPALTIGLDPAGLIMSGRSPQTMLERVAERLSLVHFRDGTLGGSEAAGRETRLGEGDVEFLSLLEMLNEMEHRGPHVLRRTDTQTPLPDLVAARETLQRMMNR